MAVVDEFITDGGWLVIPFLLVLLGVSIWIVKRALAPITRISALAESIGPMNANVRLTGRSGSPSKFFRSFSQ